MIALAELLPELSQIVPVDRLSQQYSVDIRDAPKNVVTGPGPDPCALMAADDTHHVANLTRRRAAGIDQSASEALFVDRAPLERPIHPRSSRAYTADED
jgi:hypothetical protein